MGINFKTKDLILPVFVVPGRNKKQRIDRFPDVYRYSADRLPETIGEAVRLGIDKVLLFGLARRKDASGTEAWDPRNAVNTAVRSLKKRFPRLVVMTDVCLCAYTTHGHCGVLSAAGSRTQASRGLIDGRETRAALARTALGHAEAGADWVAPSAMAKGQVSAIRRSLDRAGYHNETNEPGSLVSRGKVRILAYSAKFDSNFYGPFRAAARSAPRFSDRSGYQLGWTRPEAALREIADDIREGADMVMVKPASAYLDIIRRARSRFDFPLAAYHVSGEYAALKYGSRHRLWDERGSVFEIMTAIRRAGADKVITYYASQIARWIKEAA